MSTPRPSQAQLDSPHSQRVVVIKLSHDLKQALLHNPALTLAIET